MERASIRPTVGGKCRHGRLVLNHLSRLVALLVKDVPVADRTGLPVGLFSKRKLADPVTPSEWATRELPKPTTTIAIVAIEKSDMFGRRWKAWRKRLGLADTSAISLLADGARWIWEEQIKHLTDAEGVLDIFHALEHLATTGKVLHPDPAAFEQWYVQATEILIASGYTAIDEFVQRDFKALSEPQRQAVDELRNYLAPHAQHLNYAARLAAGQSIGSGQIEGACKNLIGRRLKANAAKWRVRRVNRMAGLCAIMYTDHWSQYWQTS